MIGERDNPLYPKAAGAVRVPAFPTKKRGDRPMKRRRERSRPIEVMHLWDRSEVTKAVPYLRSVIGSLREHWLEMLNAERQLHHSANDKAPFKRHQIIEKEK